MTNDQSGPLPVIESWDTYWRGAQSSAAYTGGGSSHPMVLSFWNDYFGALRARNAGLRIIDLASGNGAVVESASKAFGGQMPEFACLDVSASAIGMLTERFPGVSGVVADAAAIPLASSSYDIATSQFGVEYAGLGALDEVTRVIAPGGELAMLIHHRDGIIYRQCGADLDAVREMQAAKFIPSCLAMFEAAFATLAGGGRARYSAAGRQFAPAIRAMEAIMRKHGTDVAAGTIVRVYRDVRTIHERIRHYEPAAVQAWLEKMERAIEAYAGRIGSMREVAIGAARFEQVRSDLAEKRYDIVRAEPLKHPQEDLPVAWALIARRP